jgi:hypothetical protein
MKIAKVISLICLVAMTIAILNALVNGDFATEGVWILTHSWGITSLVDLYVGFVLFSMWVIYREKSLLAMIIWVVLMMILGNWTASLYVFLALNASQGDWRKFFMGARTK